MLSYLARFQPYCLILKEPCVPFLLKKIMILNYNDEISTFILWKFKLQRSINIYKELNGG
jgi:hypothetical protein